MASIYKQNENSLVFNFTGSVKLYERADEDILSCYQFRDFIPNVLSF